MKLSNTTFTHFSYKPHYILASGVRNIQTSYLSKSGNTTVKKYFVARKRHSKLYLSKSAKVLASKYI